MTKDTSIKDRVSSLNLRLLNYYDHYTPVSEVSVGVMESGNRIALDRQGKYPTARDEYCLVNEIGQMFEKANRIADDFSFEGVSDAVTAKKVIENYLQGQTCTIDKKALNEKLDKFVKNENEARSEEKAASVWGGTLRRIAMNYGKPLEYDVTGMKVMGAYFADVVKAKLDGKDLKDVALPDSRLSLFNKIAGKSYNREVETFAFQVEMLSPNQLKRMSSMLEMGIPGKETCEGLSEKYEEKGREIRGRYTAKDIKDLRATALKAITIRMAEDILKGKYFDQTGDLSVFMDDKEKAAFKKMSFKEMAETYGMDLVKTHKGAVLVGLKIAEAKEKGGAELGTSLEILKGMINDSRSESSHPDVTVDVRQRLLGTIKQSYQKFGVEDDKFRDVFKELIPNPCETAAINTMLRDSENTPLHKKMFVRSVAVRKLTAEATELATGKSDIREAKKRLKSRQKAMKEEMVNNTGFAANAALAEQAAKGYGITEKAVKHERAEVSKKRQASLDKIVQKKKEKSK